MPSGVWRLRVKCRADSPHRFGRRRKEVPPRVPPLQTRSVDQSDVRFMDQSSGLQRLTQALTRHSECRQLPQFVVHQRQQLRRRRRVAGIDSRQDRGDVCHWSTNPFEQWIIGLQQLKKHRRIIVMVEAFVARDLHGLLQVFLGLLTVSGTNVVERNKKLG